MSAELQSSPVAPRIASLLAALRLRIRGYIWAEGLAMVVVALGAAFWLSLAFDWLFEPPWQFRAIMLIAVAVAVGYIAYRYLLQRVFRRMDDTSMAVLLERRFRDYQDSLLTTVELGSLPSHAATFNREMLAHTRDAALSRSEEVDLGDVFRYGPLLRTLLMAAALAVSALALGIFARETFATWLQRVVMLDPDLRWPRKNHVRVQGFSEDRLAKVAKGSDLEIVAIADLQSPFQLPDSVEIRYRTAEGTKGRDNMATVGIAGPRDREQKYVYTFKGIMSPIDFDVYGGDDRDRDFHIEVVDNPTLNRMELACEYPAYTGRVRNTLPASGLMQLPQGTKVTIHCEANKDLTHVQVTQVRGDKATALPDIHLPESGDRRKFEVALPELMEETTLLFDLHDVDGIRGREPVRLTLAVIPDDVPIVALRLRGISNAITPQARLPVVGDARDDYGLTRLWYEYQLGQGANGTQEPKASAAPSEKDASQPAASEQTFHVATADSDGRPRLKVSLEPADLEALDLKRLSELQELLARRNIKTLDDIEKLSSDEERRQLAAIGSQEQLDRLLAFKPEVGKQLLLTLKAADNCELPQGKNIGAGERYHLEIVSPEQLLSMLEGRELMLRRRFEVIYQELTDTRDGLARIDFTPPEERADDKAGLEPGEPGEKTENAPMETPEERMARLAKRELELRDLRVTRATDNADRSAHETLSVAEAFDDIREEMDNNRVGLESPEVQGRLKDQIAVPLRTIATDMFPRLKSRLQELRRTIDNPTLGKAALDHSLVEMDAILVEMKKVLDRMLELESYNEVVETMRKILATQKEIADETLKKQKEELKNKLRDLEE